MALIVACWAAGVFAVTASMRIGDVAIIAPFRYTRLPFGLMLGVVIFHETLDPVMILGAAIIAGSGLYSLHRETRRRRRAKNSS